MRRAFGSVAVALLLAPGVTAGAADDAGAEFFEAKVRPVLAAHCYECHGAAKQKGGLRLDSVEALRAGGDGGPAVVAGEPDQSPLIEAIRHDGPVKMPPKRKLDGAEIDALTRWVKAGAAWPSTGNGPRPAAAPTGPAVTEADRAFWAFQPVRDTPPPDVRQAEWPRTSVDRYVLAKLEASGLTPAPPAGRATLLRRATFDLTGLPPAPAEVAAFLADDRPDAYARAVDRLLASPHYGERWGRHWLDVARYGEDQAHSFEPRLYPNGFRYRDWVANAFNTDMPYDRFVLEQVAADLIDGPGRLDRLPALGFFALGPVYYGDPKKFDQVDDRIDTMTRGLLGLTVACARCHDHKFDPIPTADYYALAGVFLNTDYQEVAVAPPERVAAYDAARAEVDSWSKAADALLQAQALKVRGDNLTRLLAAALLFQARGGQRDAVNAFAQGEGLDGDRVSRWVRFVDKEKANPRLEPILGVARTVKEGDGRARDDEGRRALGQGVADFRDQVLGLLARRQGRETLDAADDGLLAGLFDKGKLLTVNREEGEKTLSAEAKGALAALRAEHDRREKAAPPQYPVAHALKDADKPAEAHVLIRGNADNPGPAVSRHFLTVLTSDSAPFSQGSGRLELARAIASPDNPLTARVMVNRVWMHHFGRGLVATPGNFGALGERPSHPELLDHLAAGFVRNGWSVKALQREIVLSAAYQQGGRTDAKAVEVDPGNRLLGRMARRRLEVEAWRDAILSVSGRLDPKVGGPSQKLDEKDNRRRTYYAAVSRHDLNPLLRLFDFPDPNITSAERSRTTVPLQDLVVMNDEFLVESAKALAARLRGESEGGDDALVRNAYLRLYGRPANDRERALGHAYLSAADPEGAKAGDLTRLERYAQALLGTNEFLFVD